MSDIATKLTYLDGTREKILTETNRLGVGLTEQDKFRDYAKGLHDGYVDILNNGTDTLYDNMEKVSGSGSDITLENTEEAPMKSEFEGNTTQEGTPTPDSPQPINVVSGRQEVSVVGKNLFDNNKIASIKSTTLLEEETINTGKKITYIGAATSTGYIWVSYVIIDLTNYVGKTIRFKCNFTPSGSNKPQYNLGLCDADGSNRTTKASTTTSGQTMSFTVPELVGEQKYLYVLPYINNGTGTLVQNDYVEFTNMVLTIDNEDMTYEEFKGQSYEINLGKNIWNYNVSNSSNTRLNSDIFSVQPNTTYTFNTSSNNIQVINYYKDINKNDISNNNWTNTPFTYTTPSNCYYIQMLIRRSDNSNIVPSDLENIQLEKSSEATTYSPYKTPIELCGINDYKDMIFRSEGVNLFDKDSGFRNGYINSSGTFVSAGTTACFNQYISCKPNTTYTLSFSKSIYAVASPLYYDSSKTFISRESIVNNITTRTFTTPANCYYMVIQFNYDNNSTMTQEIIDSVNCQVEKGTTATSYEPYNSKGKWLLHKEIGKVVLDGSEDWAFQFTNGWRITITGVKQTTTIYQDSYTISNYYQNNTQDNVANQLDYGICNRANQSQIIIKNKDIANTTDFKTWLSTHNTTVYYVLATPTTTEITDSELISQLEEWYNQKSNKDTTYISVTSEDLPAILNVIAIKNYE